MRYWLFGTYVQYIREFSLQFIFKTLAVQFAMSTVVNVSTRDRWTRNKNAANGCTKVRSPFAVGFIDWIKMPWKTFDWCRRESATESRFLNWRRWRVENGEIETFAVEINVLLCWPLFWGMLYFWFNLGPDTSQKTHTNDKERLYYYKSSWTGYFPAS